MPSRPRPLSHRNARAAIQQRRQELAPQPVPPPGEAGPGTAIALKVLDIVGQGIDWKVLAVLSGLILGLVYAVPVEKRAEVLPSLVSFAREVFVDSPTPLLWLGWGLLGLTVAVGTPYVLLLNRQVVDQGDELSRLRGEVDPKRLSSNTEPPETR